MEIVCIEPVFVPDVFVSNIAYMQEIAPDIWRVAFYDQQISPLDGSAENVIVAKLVLTRASGISCSKRAFKEFAVRVLCLG